MRFNLRSTRTRRACSLLVPPNGGAGRGGIGGLNGTEDLVISMETKLHVGSASASSYTCKKFPGSCKSIKSREVFTAALRYSPLHHSR